jgi:hypothetical protein
VGLREVQRCRLSKHLHTTLPSMASAQHNSARQRAASKQNVASHAKPVGNATC